MSLKFFLMYEVVRLVVCQSFYKFFFFKFQGNVKGFFFFFEKKKL